MIVFLLVPFDAAPVGGSAIDETLDQLAARRQTPHSVR